MTEYYVALPKITDEIEDLFNDTDLLELDGKGDWQWTQVAIDFAAYIELRDAEDR